MTYWSELYKEIAEKIEANMEQIRWIDLWHEQVNYLTEELPFPTPAVFVGFSTQSTEDTGTLVQQCNIQVDFYLFYETFSDSYEGSFNQDGALDFLDCLSELHALFHGKNGVNYSEMRRTDMRREESGGSGNLYRISFECIVTDYAAQVLFNEVENSTKDLVLEDVNTEIPVDNKPLYTL